MPKVHTLTLGTYQTNTYIVHKEDSRICTIIDPGYQPQAILDAVYRLGLSVGSILLTHGHFDHSGSAEFLAEDVECNLWMHRSDYALPQDRVHSFYFPIANSRFPDIFFCGEGDTITIGGLTFTVLSTPGHTQGSVCYLCEDVLFSGDTLFAGSCGRTDLPGGDWNTIRASLKRLASLEEELLVLPGHGESTTLAQEKRYNPYLR